MMLESFVDYLKAQGKREDTARVYARSIMRFMESDGNASDPEQFAKSYQLWFPQQGNSGATQSLHKAAGQIYYYFLTGKKQKFDFPASARKSNNPTPWLTPNQFDQLLGAMKELSSHKGKRAYLYRRNVTIIQTFVYTGLKVSQVAQLDVGDVDFKENCVMNGDLRIPMAPSLRDALRLWIDHRSDLRQLSAAARKRSPLFRSSAGKRMCRRTISLMIESYYLPGLKITPEILRHTFAKWMLEATNNDTELVSQLLGATYSPYLQPESRLDLAQMKELPLG
ncbi:tyrosine-type recombinase/integrase [Cohnella sp. GCM10020058]|uniref:tyrosine-type recombinase/integrase n=1 Tax=Cohnella sp. GCM10020058 TaxID=3317330 RepID=UPI003640CFF1